LRRITPPLFSGRKGKTDYTGRFIRFALQIFLKKLFYTPSEVEEFIKLADSDKSGEVEPH
jgi:hypothetical protein